MVCGYLVDTERLLAQEMFAGIDDVYVCKVKK
jgi:hypothetical protein